MSLKKKDDALTQKLPSLHACISCLGLLHRVMYLRSSKSVTSLFAQCSNRDLWVWQKGSHIKSCWKGICTLQAPQWGPSLLHYHDDGMNVNNPLRYPGFQGWNLTLETFGIKSSIMFILFLVAPFFATPAPLQACICVNAAINREKSSR